MKLERTGKWQFVCMINTIDKSKIRNDLQTVLRISIKYVKTDGIPYP